MIPLTANQKHAARLTVKGLKNIDISKQLNVNKSTITRWAALAEFQMEVDRLCALADNCIMDGSTQRQIENLAKESLSVLEDILKDERDTPQIVKLKLNAALEVLNRAGFSPVQRMDVRKQTMNATVSSEQIAELKKRLKLVNENT